MMKKIIMVLTVLLFAVSAYAVNVEVSGDYAAEGTYQNNLEFVDEDEVQYSYYEHEMNLAMKFVVDETTSVLMRTEIRDAVWDDGADATEDRTLADGDKYSDNINVERLYLTHLFPSKTALTVGLMTGGAWATAFGDNANGKYRLKVVHPIDDITIIGVIQKNKDQGVLRAVKDGEKDDSDSFMLGSVIMVDKIAIKPLLVYTDRGDLVDDEESDLTQTQFHLGCSGQIDAIGFESELILISTSNDDKMGAEDTTVYGFYANVFSDINDNLKVGGWLAYGSVDEEDDVPLAAFDFGDDFDSSLIYGDEVSMGDIVGMASGGAIALGGSDLAGCTAIKLYMDASGLVDNLTISPSILYWMSNISEWDGNGMEMDVVGTYKITDALTYTAGLAYATVNSDDAWEDGAAMMLYHQLAIEF